MIKLLIAALTGFFFVVSAPDAHAHYKSNPSFNCYSASNATEYSICHSRRLARLDQRLAYWYGKAKVRAGYFELTTWLRGKQRAWLYERNSCGSSRWCIAQKYRQRIRTLRNWVTHV